MNISNNLEEKTDRKVGSIEKFLLSERRGIEDTTDFLNTPFPIFAVGEVLSLLLLLGHYLVQCVNRWQ